MSRRPLGRLPRGYDQSVPHYSSLTAGRRLGAPPVPMACSRLSNMPQNFGMMGNDALGDCTCAALGHAVQVTSFMAGHEITPTDEAIIGLYEEACGYVTGRPDTDKGGVEQDVLTFVHHYGIPTGSTTVKVLAYSEVDYRNLDDLKRVIWETGFVYAGLNIPAAWENSVLWSSPGASDAIAGGHAIILAGYDAHAFYGISWGEVVTIPNAALTATCDETYQVLLSTISPGQRIAGLSIDQHIQAMPL